MEGGIIVFHRSEGLFHPDFRGQFFLNFPFEGLFRCFSRLDLSSRKFPVIFKFSIAPLGGKGFILVHDRCSHTCTVFKAFSLNLNYIHYIIGIVQILGQQQKKSRGRSVPPRLYVFPIDFIRIFSPYEFQVPS